MQSICKGKNEIIELCIGSCKLKKRYNNSGNKTEGEEGTRSKHDSKSIGTTFWK